jgi:hypothetical protein
MGNTDATLTDVTVRATQNSVIKMLAAQYSHMGQAEAKTALERLHDPVWTNDELLDQFEVSHFDPPCVHVIKKANGQRGTVAFIDSPRLYFAFQPEEKHDAGTP